jgi:hypothetical protein
MASRPGPSHGLISWPSGTSARGNRTLNKFEVLGTVAGDAEIDLKPGARRLNVVIEAVSLNHLVGERFEVDDVVCEGLGSVNRLATNSRSAAMTASFRRCSTGLDTRVVELGTLAPEYEVRW